MQLGQKQVSRGFGATLVLLSPLWVSGIVLLTIAVLHDFFYFSGEVPVAIGLCAPAAYLLLRWAVPLVTARLGEPLAASPMPDAAD